MEILENSGSQGSSNFTAEMKMCLTEAAKWGKFLAITGFVGIGFIVVAAFVMGTVFSTLSNQPGMEAFGGVNMGVGFTIIYLLLAVLWFFPVLYLYKFSTGILKNIQSFNSYGIEVALQNLKALFKYYGIFTVVVLAFYALLLVIGIITTLINLI